MFSRSSRCTVEGARPRLLANQSDGVSTLHAGKDLFSLFKGQIPTTRLCCDVSRHHAASLPEPPRSCPFRVAESSRRFVSSGSATNRQPELSEHRSLGWTHPTPPSIQRCCDDSLSRSLPGSANA